MPETVIRVENVSKLYRVGRREQRPDTLVGALAKACAAPLASLRRLRRLDAAQADGTEDDVLWALRDVSFEVEAGTLVGIIGRNGAGKSTLLKILSQISPPSRGRVRLRGRVGSLLEVGTGFHPELTGRENVYMNGTILGMSRREIAGKFDEIVAFSGVEPFLDTPVKHYSSGMRVRLAFAVAAHLEPEILIVDEVLAVGDAHFQKKCLSKMEDVSGHGRTVLVVSHHMNTITRLCPRAILLDQGRLIGDGPAHEVVRTYLRSSLGTTAERQWTNLDTAPGNHIARLHSVRIRDEEGKTIEVASIRQPVGIEMGFAVLTPGHVLTAYFHLFDEHGHCLFVTNDQADLTWFRRCRPAGEYTCTAWIPGNFLAEGMFTVSAAVSTLDPELIHFSVDEAVGVQIVDSHDGGSIRGDYRGTMPGVIRPALRWDTQFEPQVASAPADTPVVVEGGRP